MEISMKKYEYEITKHPADLFSELVFFCSETGECKLNQVPHDQTAQVKEILNDKGKEGWELVTINFGKDGMIAFWKREVG